ncbi:MAG: PH domain-containing protein [Parcubacteria group bacterium]|nr:PH domain-containing protein [Parcubacteria group bacterium]
MDIRKVIKNLDDDEDVRGVYHEFWLVYFWQCIGGFLLFLSPFFFLYLFLTWGTLGSVLLGLLFLSGTFWLYRTWRRWYYGIIGITSKRVVIIRQNGILDRMVSQIDLDKIYDVTYRRKGILQNLINVGTLYLTPGSFEKVELGQIKDPAAIQKLILKTQQEFMVTLAPRQFSEQDLHRVIGEIRSLAGEERWKRIQAGDKEDEQKLIDEVREAESEEKARAIEQFFGG